MESPDLSSRREDAAVKAVEKLDKIDREKCRNISNRHFTSARMAQDYLNIYDRLIRRDPESINTTDGVPSWTKLASPSSTT